MVPAGTVLCREALGWFVGSTYYSTPCSSRGKWYTVGVAGNALQLEEQDQFKMYTSNYELKEDELSNVTSILLR